MSKFACYSKGYHPEISCMKNKIGMLTQLLENNNISLPDCSKKREGGSNSEDRERVHALVVGTSSSPTFIIDFGASLAEISTQNGPFNFHSNSMSSCVS